MFCLKYAHTQCDFEFESRNVQEWILKVQLNVQFDNLKNLKENKDETTMNRVEFVALF